MKKLFEIDINEDYRRAIISQYFLMIFIFLMVIVIRAHEKSFLEIGSFVELLIFSLLFKFYFMAQRKRNYAYWGISFILGVYIFINLLHFTFISYDIFVLYISFLAAIFLGINSYVMSSPLFYPRVQWWEYDFRFRGDLKTIVKTVDDVMYARVTDLRRGSGCVEAFEYIELDNLVRLQIKLNETIYEIEGIIKTYKQVTPGRPIRYGIKFDLSDENTKKTYYEIKEIWDEENKVKIRNKFQHQARE